MSRIDRSRGCQRAFTLIAVVWMTLITGCIEPGNYNIQGVEDATAREIFAKVCEVLSSKSEVPLRVDDLTGGAATVEIGKLDAWASWSGMTLHGRAWDCIDGGANVEVTISECGPGQDAVEIARTLVDEIVANWERDRGRGE